MPKGKKSPKGMHKMNGKMMPDKAMKQMMKSGKKGKY